MPTSSKKKRQRDTSPDPRKAIPKKARGGTHTEADNTSMKSTDHVHLDAVCKPVLVILPGSSGKISKRMTEFINGFLSNHFSVRIREGRWKGWKPLGSENVETVLEHCPVDGVWYALANSFGNRVLCEMYAADKFVNQPAGLILCGYPLYGEKCTPERVTTLQALPSHSKVLAISGSNDEFLSRAPRGESLVGVELLRSILDSLLCKQHTRFHVVPSGGHGVLDVPAKQVTTASTLVLQQILDFIETI